MNQLPTVKEELERKTVETLHWLVSEKCGKNLTDSEFKVAVQTAFGITSGLVSSEVGDMLVQMNANPKAKSVVKRVFANRDTSKLYVVSWVVGEASFSISGVAVGMAKTQRVQKYADACLAERSFERLCHSMVDSLELIEI